MIGELAAFASALLWAGSTVVLRSLSRRIPLFMLSAGRTVCGALAYWAIFSVLGEPSAIARIPLWAFGYLVLAIVTGLLCGDLLYLRGQELIGVSRAMPISVSYPIITAVLATFLLNEDLTVRTFAGIVITIVGVALVARPPAGRLLDASSKRANGLGLAAAFGASFFWALSTITLRPAVEAVDPTVANAIRLPIAATLLVGLATSRGQVDFWRHGWQTVLLLGGAGMLHAMSSGLYLVALQFAGAARAATLTATAPIFAAPLAFIFLRERPPRTVLLGTIVSVVGISLVV